MVALDGFWLQEIAPRVANDALGKSKEVSTSHCAAPSDRGACAWSDKAVPATGRVF